MATIRTKIITGVSISLGIVATTAVSLRFWARRIKRAGYGIDDWTILAALVSALMMCIAAIVGSQAGLLGKHTLDAQGHPNYTLSQLGIYNRSVWIISWNAALCPGITKVAVILLYRRIFNIYRTMASRSLLYAIWFLLTVSIAWTVTFVLTNFFGCVPRETHWTFVTPIKCAKSGDMWMTMAISSVIINAIILGLPSFPLRKLQMSTGRKLAIAAIFALGGFTVVAGCLRAFFYWQAIYTRAHDVRYDRAYGYLWSIIEACVGILSACLPCLGPILRKKGLRSMLNQSRPSLAPSSAHTDSESRAQTTDQASQMTSSMLERSDSIDRKGPQLRIYHTTEWSLTRGDETTPPLPNSSVHSTFVPPMSRV